MGTVHQPIGHCLKTNGQSHPGEMFAPQEKWTAAGNQGFQDIQAGVMNPDMSAYGTRFSANDCFNGVRGPHHTIMAGSVGYGEDSARLPASKTLGEGLISNSSILQQIGALTQDVVALTRFRAKAIEQINIQKGGI
jgi:hypothetical protein